MLTGKLKNQVDEIWEVFWTGGVTNPISVIEQFTYLLFIRRLDQIHTSRERQALLADSAIEQPIFATAASEHYRWSRFKDLDPEQMFTLVKDAVFPFIKTINGEDSAFAKHMSDAIFMIPKAAVLDRVINLIDQIDMNDRDTKGDLYEYMLSKLQSSGTNGQFRTPRHIIRLMVTMTQPVLRETREGGQGGAGQSDIICDPASGTCGFLMAAEEYVRSRFKDQLLQGANQQHFHHRMFNAYDFDQHMLRIGAMNLMLPDLIFRFVIKDDHPISKIYLWALFSNTRFRKKVQSLATGASGSMPNISKAKLADLQIPVPDSKMQFKFEKLILDIWKQQKKCKKMSTKYNDLFNALMQRAFKGELNLPGAAE